MGIIIHIPKKPEVTRCQEYRTIYTIILLTSVCLSVLANSRSQFLLDRLGRCLKPFVGLSTENIPCYELVSQFGQAIFYAINTHNYRESRVARAIAYLNEAAPGHCSPVTVDRSGKCNKSKRRQREIIPSRLEKCGLGIIT